MVHAPATSIGSAGRQSWWEFICFARVMSFSHSRPLPAMLTATTGSSSLNGSRSCKILVYSAVPLRRKLELLGAGRQCIPEAGDFPTASPVSPLQDPSRRITNLCHRTILMDDDMACFVLARLDGTLDQDSLCDLMTEALETGQIHIPKLDTRHGETVRELMRLKLALILQQLPRCGVLILQD